MLMTWKEFKKFTDNEIKKLGYDENVKIDYIDISYPDLNYEMSIPNVGIDEDGMGIS